MIGKQELKSAKLEIEDVLGTVLQSDALENALNLVAYLRENKMNPAWSATNVWKVTYKTYTVCFMRVYGAAEYHGLQGGHLAYHPFYRRV